MAIDARLPVPTTRGWLPAGLLSPGDEIFGFDGLPIKVTLVQKYTPTHCYKIWVHGGLTLVMDAKTGVPAFDRVTSNSLRRWGRKTNRNSTSVVWPQGPEIMMQYKFGLPKVPVCQPLRPKERNLPVAPFTLGQWIFETSNRRKESRTDITRELIERYPTIPTHIPEEYLFGSFRQRLELLRGIVSTRPRCYKNKKFTIYVLDLQLARQVQNLVESMGIQSFMTFRKSLNQYAVSFRTILRLRDEQELPDKVYRLESRVLKKIEKVDARECVYIKTEDPNNTFLVSEGFLGVSL